MDVKLIEEGVRMILRGLGEDTTRDGLVDTPARVARMYEEMLAAIAVSNDDIAAMFNTCFPCKTNQMVVVKDIPAFSFCEHHMALMYDMTVSVGYIPQGQVIGLSKIPRIVDMCCKRLQLQEKIGEDIAEVLVKAASCQDVIVHITSKHSCVTARGIKANNSLTTTLAKAGRFVEDNGLVDEFFKMLDR